jgi:hypothetical protein
MTKKQTLTGSNFAGFRAIAEHFKNVQHCEIVSSRNIVGSVKEVVFLVTTPEQTAEVAVWVIGQKDKTYRTLFLVEKGDVEMSSTQPKFDPTRITYQNEEEARKYAAKNARVCERLNAGEKFAFLADIQESDYLPDDAVDIFYSFIALANDGEIIPTPIFFEALGNVERSEATHEDLMAEIPEVTVREICDGLHEQFGDQFIGHQANTRFLAKARLVKIEGSEVTVVSEFDLWDKPAEAKGVPRFQSNIWDNDASPKYKVHDRWLIQQILLDQAPEYLIVLVNNDDLKDLTAAVKNAAQVKEAILGKLGSWPTELSQVWECVPSLQEGNAWENPATNGRSLIEHWGQCMVIYHHTGFWPRAHAQGWKTPLWRYTRLSPFGSHDHTITITNGSHWGSHEIEATDPEDTQWLVALARAMKRGSVASRSWEQPWPNGRGSDSKVVYVWEDSETGLTFSNSYRDRNSREDILGRVEVYKRHFGLK